MAGPRLPLAAGEMLVESLRANRTQGGRAVGGHLYLTSHRLIFEPHGFDAATGGQAVAVPLAVITAADVSPRGWSPFDGSLRRRLRVMTDRGPEYFVVRKAAEVAARIERARAG